MVKSRLTGSSRASDITFLYIALMNGLMGGKIYDWLWLPSECMYEFMTLQHKTFYMTYYAIGLFLDAMLKQILVNILELKPRPLVLGEPHIT